jgi:hypothetical protein
MIYSDSEPRPETPTHNYNLHEDEIARLTAELLDEREPVGDDRFVCYKLEGDDKFADIARHIETVVFDEAFNNSSKDMEREYGPYEDQSEFFVSIDRESKKATGALRIIKNGPVGLKTLNDVTQPPFIASKKDILEGHGIDDLDECVDVGTVAVLPEYRSAQGGISVQLYRAMYVNALEDGTSHLISIVDEKPLSKLTDYLGIPFVPLGNLEGRDYLGSEKSQPVYGYIPDFYKKMNRKRYTLKGLLAKKVLQRLVKGTQDSELQFSSRYKK